MTQMAMAWQIRTMRSFGERKLDAEGERRGFLGKCLSMLACLNFMLTLRLMHGEGTFHAAGWWGNPRTGTGLEMVPSEAEKTGLVELYKGIILPGCQ